MTAETAVPSFRRSVRFRLDSVREGWVLLAPEKLFMPDEVAVEILKLVDGERTIGSIADDLAARFDAPRDIIVADVLETLQDLSDRGAVHL